jgi:hypothetical protein
VFWPLRTRETSWLPPWRDLPRLYRRLEARSDIRSGRFVAGFSAEQYALPSWLIGRRRTPFGPMASARRRLGLRGDLGTAQFLLACFRVPGGLIVGGFSLRAIIVAARLSSFSDGRNQRYLVGSEVTAMPHIIANYSHTLLSHRPNLLARSPRLVNSYLTAKSVVLLSAGEKAALRRPRCRPANRRRRTARRRDSSAGR